MRLSVGCANPGDALASPLFSLEQAPSGAGETTFVRFRKTLRERKLFDELFAAIGQQLDKKGLLVKQGTLIDATIVEADAKRPPVSEGEISMIDPDAGFTKKNGESYFGYKMHVGVDEGSTLIRQVEGTTADINDCLVFKGLLNLDPPERTFIPGDFRDAKAP